MWHRNLKDLSLRRSPISQWNDDLLLGRGTQRFELRSFLENSMEVSVKLIDGEDVPLWLKDFLLSFLEKNLLVSAKYSRLFKATTENIWIKKKNNFSQ